ncbi:alpha/beta fold hydrolase [Ilumatobacter nonamiensis]|uniref:alpha/beta fold hydrolase n=1 Tax=Ilumatobacter nonamiensis TaxID=467093 RepID=UPI000348032A|nr:alpha/beta hydrolase [Ilumatobacter nonamiensis]
MADTTDPTVVLVHGVPETPALWQPLIHSFRQRGIDRVRTLAPPGFGAQLPADFSPSADAYAEWLVAELERLDADGAGPIDIVGHDWGAGHVYRLMAERPDLVRSWVADIAGLLHPDYRWHDMATMWQRPDVGEQVIEAMVSPPLADRVALLTGLGLPDDMAAEIAPAINPDMGRAILALYRSAPESALQVLADRLAASDHRPGAIITAADDAYVAADLAPAVAERLGVPELRLEGQGHWWMVSDPDGAAEQLVSFWSSL